MTALYVLDVVDFRPVAEVAAQDPTITVRRRGPYFELSSNDVITIDRSATGCRNALWYSSIAAIKGGRVTTWDKTVLVVEPTAV
jgi:hypothetical protein